MSILKVAFQVSYSVLMMPLLALLVRYSPAIHRIVAAPLLSGPCPQSLSGDIQGIVSKYEQKKLSEEEFIAEINSRMCEAVNTGEIDKWLKKEIKRGESVDITLARHLGYAPLRWWYLKLHFMAEGNDHSLHAHRNVLSTQVVAAGSLEVQEYDLIGSLDDNPTRLKFRREEEVKPVAGIISTDRVANVHGFRPIQTPAVRFQFYLRGHTGPIKMLTPKRGRLYVHPLGNPDEDGVVWAEIGESGRAGES